MISFIELYGGWITGIIDSYGSVHSTFQSNNVSTEDRFHSALYPSNIFKRWRWTYDKGIVCSVLSDRLDIEEYYKIEKHITRKYRIKFWDNGYHDIDYFMKKMEEEEKG